MQYEKANAVDMFDRASASGFAEPGRAVFFVRVRGTEPEGRRIRAETPEDPRTEVEERLTTRSSRSPAPG